MANLILDACILLLAFSILTWPLKQVVSATSILGDLMSPTINSTGESTDLIDTLYWARMFLDRVLVTVTFLGLDVSLNLAVGFNNDRMVMDLECAL